MVVAGFEVLTDGGDGIHGGDGLEADLLFHGGEIIVDEVEDLSDGERLAKLAEIHQSNQSIRRGVRITQQGWVTVLGKRRQRTVVLRGNSGQEGVKKILLVSAAWVASFSRW